MEPSVEERPARLEGGGPALTNPGDPIPRRDFLGGESPSTLGGKVRIHLANLLPIFGVDLHREGIFRLFDLMTRESLALPLDAPIPPFSKINNDGVPFEFSVSLGGGEGGLRFLTEVGVPGTSLPNRINLTCARLNAILDHIGMRGAGKALNAAIRQLFPLNPRELKGWTGGMWLAVRCLQDGRIGLRVYADATGGQEPDRWFRLGRLLAELGKAEALARLCELSPTVSRCSFPLGIAMDVVPDGVGRVKFYLRTREATPSYLHSVFAATGHGHRLPAFFTLLDTIRPEGPRSSLPGLVISLELPNKPSGGVDLKVDICAHCLFGDDRSAQEACLNLIGAWSLDPSPYRAVLDELSGGSVSGSGLSFHAFVGAGFSHEKEPRLNIYLKPAHGAPAGKPRPASPPSPVSPPPARGGDEKATAAAVASAARFLVGKQSSTGQWIDFLLPPGPSDAWVTAFVGLSLARLPAKLRTKETGAAVASAANWCLEAMGTDGGWGYNSRTGSDADSTAHALLFLASAGQAPPAGCLGALKEFQRSDGGFATYRIEDPNDSWGQSHADVTPAALAALLANGFGPGDDCISAGRRFLEGKQGPDGIWPSFWWDSVLYGTFVNLALFRQLRWPHRSVDLRKVLSRLPLEGDSFDLSLLLGCLTLARTPLEGSLELSLLSRLIASQDPDGGFPSRPMLRLARRDSAEPWAQEDGGPHFADQRRLFTTATVLRCLSLRLGSN